MGKILKKISKTDGMYVILSIVNMYILPYILYLMFAEKLMTHNGRITYGGAIVDFSVLCFFSGGCVMQAVLTALYERRKSEKNNTAFWLTVLLSVPLAVGMIMYFVGKDTLMNESVLISSVMAAPVCAAAGMWVGRLISGKYRDEKRFYAADKIFIGISVLLAVFYCLNIYFNDPSEAYNDEISLYIILIFGIVCILYSRFSEFEYLAEKLVRAMVTGFVVFMPCGFLYRILLETPDLSHYSYYSYNYAKEVLFAAPLAAAAAFIGVLTGYYLRIMKHGGDETVKKIPLVKKLKKALITFAVLGAFIGGIKLFAENKYWFCKNDTNLWELTGANEEDIHLLRLESDRVKDHEFYLTADKKTISAVVELMKKEKGARNVEPYNSPMGDGYKLKAYDKNGVIILYTRVSRYSIGTIYVKVYDEEERTEWEELFIPAQYYQKEPTRYAEYLELMKAGEMSAEEKIALMYSETEHYIDCIDGFWGANYDHPTDENGNRLTSQDMYCTTDLFNDIAGDKDPSVRKAFAEMFGKNIDYEDHFDSYWYLKNLANDENAAVRGAAYHALGEISHTDAAKTLFGAMLSEKDEKAKFYAIIAWAKAEKNFAADKEKIQGGAYFDPMEYIKTRYNGENLRDTEKLACACALVRLGEEEYRAKANELIGKITDEEIKEAARRDLEK